MNREDFELSITGSGEHHYLLKSAGEKRKQILQDRMSGKLSQEEFLKEQKKMRGGKYLKYIYSQAEMEKAIQNQGGHK
jgi:hypothetical protein